MFPRAEEQEEADESLSSIQWVPDRGVWMSSGPRSPSASSETGRSSPGDARTRRHSTHFAAAASLSPSAAVPVQLSGGRRSSRSPSGPSVGASAEPAHSSTRTCSRTPGGEAVAAANVRGRGDRELTASTELELRKKQIGGVEVLLEDDKGQHLEHCRKQESTTKNILTKRKRQQKHFLTKRKRQQKSFF